MNVAAAALLSYGLAFAAVGDGVVVTVSAARDATSCTMTGSIVAHGSAATVRVPLRRGVTTYQLDLASENTWNIFAEVPGCWSETLTWNGGADVRLELQLDRAGILEGALESEDVPTELRGNLFSVPDAARTKVLIDGLATQCVLEWPRWQCTVPASRVLDVRLDLAGYAPLYFWDVRVAPGEALRFPPRRLEKGASVAGWVEDPDGDPEADARVSLVTLEAAPAGATAEQRAIARTLRTRTNAKGFFQFTGVAPGTYRVVSEAPRVPPARTAAIRVRPDDAVTWPIPVAHVTSPLLDITVQPSTDPRGQPWVARFVEREPLFPRSTDPLQRRATETGRIAVENLHAAAYEIEIRDSAGSVVEIAGVDLSSGGEHTLTIDIHAIAVTGTLRCGDEPLEAELTFTNLTGRSVRTKTDTGGRFDVSFPSAGIWETEMRYPVDARASMISLEPVEIPAGAAATLDVRVPGGRINGQVTTGTGTGTGTGEQAAVHVRSRGRIVAQLVTNADGTFDLVGIPAGTYVVDAEGRGGTTRNNATVTIEEQETQTVHLRLEPYRWIRGVIRTPSGAPASGASVRVSTDRGARWTRTVTDIGGKFEYPLPADTDDVQLIVLTYTHPAVALRTAPTSFDSLEITLPATGGILHVDGGQNPAIQSRELRVPLRFLHFPEPYGQYGGGVHLPAGSYVVCPSMDPHAECRSVTIAPSAETRIAFAPPKETQ